MKISRGKRQLWVTRVMAFLMALLLPTLALAQVQSAAYRRDSSYRNGLVRVYLSSLGSRTSLNLTLKAGYTANGDEIPLASGTRVTVGCNASTGQMTLSAGGNTWNMGDYFTLNRSGTSASLTIAQASTSNPYPADFSFYTTRKNGSYVLYPVAHIQMQQYLYGVLPYEMGNGAPLEALKAQAVAARTYTIRMMENRASGRYDVVDTTSDQVYRGTPSGNANCKAAVDGTNGIILKYGSKNAETYYSSSNGGQTESAANIWGSRGYDYLTVQDDPFDAASTAARIKKVTIYKDLAHAGNHQGLMALLKGKAVTALQNKGYAATSANTRLIWLEGISLHTPKYNAPSRLYTKADFAMTVDVAGTSASVTVTADVFRELESLLGMSLQSSSNEIWTVKDQNSSFQLRAGRYGHGVGMSQYGSMEMGRQGYTYDYILGFYYPGCTRVQLNLSGGTMDESGSGSESAGGTVNPTPTPAPSGSGSQQPIGYVTVEANGFINLRSGPSLSHTVRTTAPEGATLAVLYQEGSWYYVEYNGVQAYAVSSLLSPVYQQTETTPAPSETPAQSPTATPAPNAGIQRATIYSTNGTVNFRDQPSLSSRVMMQLYHGTPLEVTGTDGIFTSVVYNGIAGYVMTSYLRFDEALTTPQPTEPATGTYRQATVTTAQGSLNLREQPQSYARILLRMPQYAQLEAYEMNATWCRVRYAGVEGYAMKQYLTFASSGESTQPATPAPVPSPTPALPDSYLGTARVTTASGSLNLRLSPNRTAQVLRTIPRNQMVEVYSISGDWAMVHYQGYVGYVMVSYLTLSWQSSTPATPVPTQTKAPATPAPPTIPVDNLPANYTEVSGMTALAQLSYVNLRQGPSLDDFIITVVPKGEKLPVLALGAGWCVVAWNNQPVYAQLCDVTLSYDHVYE